LKVLCVAFNSMEPPTCIHMYMPLSPQVGCTRVVLLWWPT